MSNAAALLLSLVLLVVVGTVGLALGWSLQVASPARTARGMD